MRVGILVAELLVMVVATGGTCQAPILKTKQGYVSGLVDQASKGRIFYSYYGIPFAKPPLGPLRFKDPELGEKWSGVRNGSVMPEPCLNLGLEPFLTIRKAEEKDYSGSEDCLYLNVFTPKPRDDPQKLPVMVWFHGGGFFSGGANLYHPHFILNHDVVLVVVQYRLGILGFLSTGDLVMPGNLGLKDQTQALRWIQKNIKRFGGDKNQVTIFGDSAGGASVIYHMMIPATKGLFSRVIAQSGSALCPWSLTRTAAQTAKRVAEALSCPTNQGSQEMLECLQVLDARQIVYQTYNLFDWSLLPLLMAPRVDGVYLPAEPGRLMREGKITKVDLMSGTTKDEGSFFSLQLYALENVTKAVEDNFSVIGPTTVGLTEDIPDRESLAREVYQYYLGGTHVTRDNIEQVTQMISDALITVCHDLTVIHHACVTRHKKTFSYELQHKGQQSVLDVIPANISKEWVSHTDELFYLFPGGVFAQPSEASDPQDLITAEDREVRDIITKLWTNFAATGHPTPDATLGFIWEATTPDTFQHLAITTNPRMIPDTRQEVRNFFSSLPTPTNIALHPYLVEPRTPDETEL